MRAPFDRQTGETSDLHLGTFGSLTQFVRLQAWPIIGSTLGCFLLGTAYLTFAPPTYKATAAVLIDFRRLAPVSEDISLSNGRIDSSAVQSQVAVMTSSAVLRRVVVDEKLDKDPEFVGGSLTRLLSIVGLMRDPAALPDEDRIEYVINRLVAQLDVDRIDMSYVILIAMTAHDPAKAARIANKIAEAYISDQLNAKKQVSNRAIAWLNDRIDDLHAGVDRADNAVVKYRTDNNIVLADGKFMDETRVADLNHKLSDAQQQEADAAAKLARIEQILARGTLEGGVTDEFTDEVIVGLRNKYAETQRKMKDLAARYGSSHDAVLKLKATLDNLQGNIFDEFRRIEQSYRSDAEIAKSQEDSLKKQLADLASGSAKAQESRVRLQSLSDSADSIKSIRDDFLGRYLNEIQRETFPVTEARIVGRALAPLDAISPSAPRALGGGLAIGLALGFGVGFLRELLSNRIRTRAQAEQAAAAPCFAVLPKIAFSNELNVRDALAGARRKHADQRNDLFDLVHRDPFSHFAEGLRAAKLVIDEKFVGRTGKVLGFVSLQRGEGASTLAANFALLCARAEGPSILVDGDLRAAALTRHFTPTTTYGLAEAVLPASKVPNAGVLKNKHGWWFLPAFGKQPNEPQELLKPALTAPFFDLLREYFSYIIVDLPAIADAVDASCLARVVDGFVLVVESGRTDIDVMAETLRAKPAIGDNIVGILVNKSPDAV